MTRKIKDGDYESLINNLNNKAEKDLREATSESLEEHLKHAEHLEEAVLHEKTAENDTNGVLIEDATLAGSNDKNEKLAMLKKRLYQFLMAASVFVFGLFTLFITVTESDEDYILNAFFVMFFLMVVFSRQLNKLNRKK